jgi:hypothetical protein
LGGEKQEVGGEIFVETGCAGFVPNSPTSNFSLHISRSILLFKLLASGF